MLLPNRSIADLHATDAAFAIRMNLNCKNPHYLQFEPYRIWAYLFNASAISYPDDFFIPKCRFKMGAIYTINTFYDFEREYDIYLRSGYSNDFVLMELYSPGREKLSLSFQLRFTSRIAGIPLNSVKERITNILTYQIDVILFNLKEYIEKEMKREFILL